MIKKTDNDQDSAAVMVGNQIKNLMKLNNFAKTKAPARPPQDATNRYRPVRQWMKWWMEDSEKLCLKQNDFQENLNSAFGGFRNDHDFADVTLACEDGTQIKTHKLVLASSSPFFMEILKKNKHPHTLIYMRGLNAEALVAMVDFLY